MDLIFGTRAEPAAMPVLHVPAEDANAVWRFDAEIGGGAVVIFQRGDGLFYFQELRLDRIVNPIWGDREETYVMSTSGLFGSLEDARRAAEAELHWMTDQGE